MLLVSTMTLTGAQSTASEDNMTTVIDPVVQQVFVENIGQLENDDIEFYTMGQFKTGLGDEFIRYSLERKMEDNTLRTDCWQIDILGGRPVSLEGSDPSSTIFNFFYETGEFTGINTFNSVIYEDIYPQIDLFYHFVDNDLKYDMILEPGSDPSNIVLGVSGHRSMYVLENDLVIELEDGTLIRERGLDVFYQDTKEKIDAEFTLMDENTFTFTLDDYDRTRTVVIDPVVFSTWVGGLGSDQAYGMEVDGQGNSYVTGSTTARQFPVTVGAYETQWQGSQDAYIFRMNDTGKGIDFCTLIGGSSDEAGMVIHLDDNDNIYLTGRVASDDFPTSNNPYSDRYSGLYDVFVSKFNPTASNLLFSTYVGGSSSEWPQNIIVDDLNNVFVGGICNGEGFPTSTNPISDTYGGGDIDGFLFKLNPQGSQLLYSTYIGGDHDDRVTGLVLDEEGYAYITGYTRSTDFTITNGAYDTTRDGSSDAYIMKVAHDGKSAIYSTLFGGSMGDGIYDLALDDEGDLVFTGLTYSTDLPTSTGVVSSRLIGDADIFLAEMDINCTTVHRCTYVGSTEYEKPTSLHIGALGKVTITGETSSDTFPVTNDALLSSRGEYSDPFLVTILPDWSAIQYASYLGGGRIDQIAGAGTDDRGRIYGAGSTDNENFPTTNGSFNEANNGFEDVYVFSISLDTPPTSPRDLTADAGDNYVNLSWNTPKNPGSLDLIGYDIFKGDTIVSISHLTTVGLVLHYNDTDVENGKTYFYRVRAKNSALDSIPSPVVQATPLGTPSTPPTFSATGGYMKVDLTWDTPEFDGGSEVLGFNVYRTNGHVEIVIPMSPDLYEFTDEAVEPGTEYSYAISAFNIIGESTISSPVTTTPVSEPSSPMNLTLRSGNGFVDISWTQPVMDGGMLIREYNVYRGVSGGNPSLLKNMGASVRKYNDTTVHNGLIYSYYVVAVNIIGESLPTERLEATPMTSPSMPMNFIVTAGNERVELMWEAPIDDGGSPITGYKMRKVTGEDTPVMIDLDGTSYPDNDVENGMTYTYSLASINSVGISPWTREIQVIPATIPESPSIDLISIGADHIHVGWSQPASSGGKEIISYELYRGEDHGSMVLYRIFSPEKMDFNDTNVMMGVELVYGIKAVNDIGPSEIIETVVATAAGLPSPPRDVTFERHDMEVWISWSEPVNNGGSPISGYTIHRTEVISGAHITSDYRGDDDLYKDMNVQPGVAYEYRITAVNTIGESIPSEEIEVIAYRAPSQITGLEVRSENDIIELSWDALDLTETGEVSIEVQRSIGLGEFRTVAVLDGTATGFHDENIGDGVTYTYRLIVRNSAGSSESSTAEVDLTGGSSSSISAGSIMIMLLGTLIPLIIAGIFIFLLVRKRKGEGAGMEETVQEENIENEVMASPMDTLPQMPSITEMVPPPVEQDQLPAPLPEPFVQDQMVPVQEESPLQEETNPYIGPPQDETPSTHDDFFQEVMQ